METYCQKIIGALKAGGKASTPPLKRALDAIEHFGVPRTRDRLKGQKYTTELLGSISKGDSRKADV